MEFERQSGVFLHVSSLPGPHGIGDLGAGARAFLAFLDRADQSLWQVCPLGPTADVHGHSPYSSLSTFAGNPLFVDLRPFRERGWLTDEELDPPGDVDPTSVEYDAVARFKRDRLRRGFERFDATATTDASGDADAAERRRAFDAFRERERGWLDDYALFAALRAEFDGAPWTEWPAGARDRDPDALDGYRESLAGEIRFREFVQWRFDEQWRALRAAAADRGVSLVGDVPVYPALDSADIWANRAAFAVEDAAVQVVAGVPPNPGDDGQRWGMPVYDWDALAGDGFGYWIDRLERLFDLVDVARLDHFTAFDRYWAIPADEPSPAAGEWRPGPGDEFFAAVRDALGELPFLAEDLGFLTEGVVGLRERHGIPGMRVPQYADWCAEHHRYKPADYPEDCVAYTSTHDTDTVVGYYRGLGEDQRDCLEYALGTDGDRVARDLLDAVWNSAAAVAMTTVPDLLGLGSDARLNTPGTATGNWRWRVERSALEGDAADRLAGATVAAMR